jgi:hypothetical protein
MSVYPAREEIQLPSVPAKVVEATVVMGTKPERESYPPIPYLIDGCAFSSSMAYGL